MELKSRKKKLSLLLLLLPMLSFAQTTAKVVGSLNNAAAEFGKYLEPTQKIIYAIAAIVAVIGGFNIFYKMNNGDQDVKKSIMLTVGGCVALVIMATALPAVFK